MTIASIFRFWRCAFASLTLPYLELTASSFLSELCDGPDQATSESEALVSGALACAHPFRAAYPSKAGDIKSDRVLAQVPLPDLSCWQVLNDMKSSRV